MVLILILFRRAVRVVILLIPVIFLLLIILLIIGIRILILCIVLLLCRIAGIIRIRLIVIFGTISTLISFTIILSRFRCLQILVFAT